MPFETSTSTGYDDLLDKLLDFLTVPTPMPANQVWTLLEERIVEGTLTGQIGDFREVYLRGPGLSATATDITSVTDNGGIARFNFTPGPTLSIDQEVIISQFTTNTSYNGVYQTTAVGAGYFEVDTISFGSDETGQFLIDAEAIHINIRTYVVPATAGDATNWELGAAVNFDIDADFRSQPGHFLESFPNDRSYVPLIDDIFTYWFVGTGRYFWVACVIDGNPKVFGGGFYLPYALPSEFPYPIYVCGNSSTFTTRYTDTNRDHINFYNPFAPTLSTYASFVRQRNGSWLELLSFDAALPSSSDDEAYLFPVNNTDAWDLISNMDGSYTMIPYTIYSGYNNGNVYGDFENLYWTPSFNITSEDIITVNSTDHVVFRNIWNSDTNRDYCALKLE